MRIEVSQMTSAPIGGPTAKPALAIMCQRPYASVRRPGSTTSATYAPAAGSKMLLKAPQAIVTRMTCQKVVDEREPGRRDACAGKAPDHDRPSPDPVCEHSAERLARQADGRPDEHHHAGLSRRDADRARQVQRHVGHGDAEAERLHGLSGEHEPVRPGEPGRVGPRACDALGEESGHAAILGGA